jgi:hypothetical protein
MVAKVPGVWKVVSQRWAKSAVGVLSMVSMPLTREADPAVEP